MHGVTEIQIPWVTINQIRLREPFEIQTIQPKKYLTFTNELENNGHMLPTLIEIWGTYWLTWVSLAIVSRHRRIIRSIDPTVGNFQVNDPDLCEIRGDENHNLPFSLLLNLLYYTTEKCRFESPLWHCFFMEICLIFYSYYIVTRGYIHTRLAIYVLYVLV